MFTYLLWSKARKQCPGGTRYTSVLVSISFNVGECTKTGAEERLYNHTPSASLLNVTPKPIFCLAFSTASGVADIRCMASVDKHIPLPRGCSAKTLTAGFSTGNKPPTRCDNSQYASWHHPVVEVVSEIKRKEIVNSIEKMYVMSLMVFLFQVWWLRI